MFVSHRVMLVTARSWRFGGRRGKLMNTIVSNSDSIFTDFSDEGGYHKPRSRNEICYNTLALARN